MYKRILVALFAISISSCQKKDGNYTNPKELIICLSVTEDYDKTVGKKQALKEYLSSVLKIPIKIYEVTNGTAVIEAVKAEKVHIGSVGAFSYIVAKTKIDIDPLVTTASVSDSIEHNYRSNLIVSKDSEIKSIKDIQENKHDLSLAWSYPTSTSGHLVPRDYLKSKGVLPEDFKEVVVAENHVAAIYSCIMNKVDLAAVNDITLREYGRRGKINEKDYRVIWKSKPIQRGAIFINNKVNENLKIQIQKALIMLHEVSPELAQKIHYQYDYDIKYIPVSDKDYNELRMLATSIGLIEK